MKIIFRNIILFSFVLIIYLLFKINYINESVTFFLLEALLVISTISWSISHFKYFGALNTMISPPFLCSVIYHITGFVTGSYLYFHPLGMMYGFNFPSFEYVIKAIFIANISLNFMWLGYYSINTNSKKFIINVNSIEKFIKKHKDSIFYIFIFLYLSGYILRIFAIQNSFFGILNKYSALSYDSQPIFLKVAKGSSSYCLVGFLGILLFYPFNNKKHFKSFLIYFILINEVYFGLISGFKEYTIMPILVIAYWEFLERKKIPIKKISVVILFLILSYSFLPSYRTSISNLYPYEDNLIKRTELLKYHIQNSDFEKELMLINFQNVTRRLTKSLDLAVAVRYKDNQFKETKTPNFISDALIYPISRFIPRSLWKNKPKLDYSIWFTLVPYEKNDPFTSSNITAEGFLYLMSGNILLIALFFFVFGCIQKIVYKSFWLPKKGFLSKLMYAYFLLNGLLIPRNEVLIWIEEIIFIIIIIIFLNNYLSKYNNSETLIKEESM